MYLKAFIQRQFTFHYNQMDEILRDVTEEQFHWIPPGNANPIACILIHILSAEDDIIQSIFRREPAIWEQQMCDRKIWIKVPPMPGQGWDEVRKTNLPMAPILEYGGIVRAATLAYLDTLNAKELRRKVVFFGLDNTICDSLVTLISHNSLHVGEIAVLKGVQGIKGLPY